MILLRRSGFLFCVAALAIGAGCGHVDVSPGGSPDRVLSGALRPGAALPAGAEVVVRLIASSTPEMTRPTNSALPVLTPTAGTTAIEQVVATHTQVLTESAAEVPFRFEYHADDGLMRRGLTLDARVSFGGKVRYRTISAHVVTLNSSAYRQDVVMQAADR